MNQSLIYDLYEQHKKGMVIPLHIFIQPVADIAVVYLLLNVFPGSFGADLRFGKKLFGCRRFEPVHFRLQPVQHAEVIGLQHQRIAEGIAIIV